MVTFQRIRIQNYKSIVDATFDYLPGIYKVVGSTEGAYSSNGAAKSAFTQALVVCCYRRDIGGASLDLLTNRNTEANSFTLTLDFEANGQYKLVCTRSNMSLTTPQGQPNVNGIKKVLSTVQTILGMGYETFVLTQYVTQQTVSYLTDNLSQPTLFNDVLQIAQLKRLDQDLHQVFKQQASVLDTQKQQLAKLQTKLEHSQIEDKFNLESLEEDLSILEARLSSLHSEIAVTESKYTPKIEQLKAQSNDFTSTIRNKKKVLKGGICPTCGTQLADDKVLKELEEDIAIIHEKLLEVSSSILKLESELSYNSFDISQDISITTQEITDKVQEINTAKVLTKYIVTKEDNLEKEHAEVSGKIKDLHLIMSYITEARQAIKSGEVVKELLGSFFSVVESRVAQYALLIHTDGISIVIKPNKLGMQVLLTREQKVIPIETLSNGEKTRISLLLLVSILDAIKISANTETNLLVFDEATSSFDANGCSELSALFNYMKSELGTSVLTVTHSTELDDLPYDFTVIASKGKDRNSSINIKEHK